MHADHVRDLEDRRATLRPRRHEAALTQTRQVGAHGRLRQPEMGCQITHPMLAQRQVLQDRQPRRIGQAVELGSGHRQIPDFRYILDRRCCRYVTMLTGEDRVTFAPPPRDLLDLILTKRLTSALSDCGILVGRHVRNGAAVHRGHHDFLEDT